VSCHLFVRCPGWARHLDRRCGWVCSDAFGTRQGPFTQDQLKEWRPFLPMNLIVTYMSSSTGPGEDGDELSTELAELIGDGALFASWQKHPANKVLLEPRTCL
jgi:hypothetical protein